MDKATGLLRIAPVIHGIEEWVRGFVCEVLEGYLLQRRSVDDVIEDFEGCFGFLRDHRSDMSDEFGGPLPTSDKEPEQESSLEKAWKLLTHPSICHIEDGGLAEMRAAVSIMQSSNDKRELTDAAIMLETACREFADHFYDRLPNHLFGEWGGEFFRYLMLRDAEQIQDFTWSIRGEPAPTDLSVDLSVAIDNETFSVRLGNRAPCSLGNSRQFKLLAHLVERPHRYISFADLAEAIGGDQFDREAVIVAKFRLCKRLTARGYEDLAKLIVSQPDHYAYWPS